MKLAAVDIGSNAVRLLVAELSIADKKKPTEIKNKKLIMYRIPVRLGVDTFSGGHISLSKIDQLCKSLEAFRLIAEVYEVQDWAICATSALREATNARQVADVVKQRTGLNIQLIDGDSEAALILSNKLFTMDILDHRFSHLYVDVGGGSTEVSLVSLRGIAASKSFKIGTIRMFQNHVALQEWQALTQWLVHTIKPKKPLSIIGSGGNINRLFKISESHKGQPLPYRYLKQEYNLLAPLSIEERVTLQDLTPDRAEVIVPALEIFLHIMEKTGITQVMVPNIGLSDGIVLTLFQQKMGMIQPIIQSAALKQDNGFKDL